MQKPFLSIFSSPTGPVCSKKYQNSFKQSQDHFLPHPSHLQFSWHFSRTYVASIFARVQLAFCHLNPERCRCCCDPWKSISCGTQIFFWSSKCELLHETRKNKKQHISCQNFSKTHSSSSTKWNQPFIFNKLAICIEEPFWSEVFRISPMFTIM